MTLRLIELVVPKKSKDEVIGLTSEYITSDVLNIEMSDDLTLFKILVTTEESESILDDLEKRFSDLDGFRIFVVPIQASLPRIDEITNDENVSKSSDEDESIAAERISREELYENVLSVSKPTKIYFIMVILSSFVASIGVLNNNVAVIIGAMVIAPLLGPNMGLSLATVLRDIDLACVAFKSIIAGIGIAIVISFIIGILVTFDPSSQP